MSVIRSNKDSKTKLTSCFYMFLYAAIEAMKITDDVLRSFKVARTYSLNKVNCVDYSPNGESAVSSSDDDSIVIYDIQQGK